MPYSEGFWLRLVAGTIAGTGAIYLGSNGIISSDATVGILSGLLAYFAGEANGIRMKSKTS